MGKITTLETLLSDRAKWRADSQTVVWTNGCFDLLHAGHVRNLRDAKAQGDILVVGVNSDRSVRANKGAERPLVPEAQRAELVAALDCVDYALIFDDLTPSEILAKLRPDVHCKGADYANGEKPMPEAEIVKGYGGRIAFLDLHPGYSTTALIERIRGGNSQNDGHGLIRRDQGSLQDWLADSFSRACVLVIGDIMLDEYVVGRIQRISPEAPVPVIEVSERRHSPGGAANVATNISALGATASLIGLIADDLAGKLLCEELIRNKVLLTGAVNPRDRHTICKTRFVAQQQQIVRVDQENTSPLSAGTLREIMRQLSELIPSADVSILSDYAKGVLSVEVCQQAIETARRYGKPVIVDPKGKDFSRYRGCTVITPNVREAALASGIEISNEGDLERAAGLLLKTLPGTALLVTRGPEGMTLYREGLNSITIPTAARNVFDVVGAGDTAAATLSVSLAAGLSLETASRLANIAAGISVEKHGTVAVKIAEVLSRNETLAALASEAEAKVNPAYAG